MSLSPENGLNKVSCSEMELLSAGLTALAHKSNKLKPGRLTNLALTAIVWSMIETIPSIIGRDLEIKLLDRLYNSPKAELISVYGRRRVGKTYLINQYFKNKGIYFEITGTKGSNRAEQLKNFHREYSALFTNEPHASPPSDWGEAMDRLKNAVSIYHSHQKIILFFDELPWLASRRSGIMAAIEYVWNRHLSRMNNVIVIVCGSAASWMIQHVIENKAGLFGRISAKIPLYPFDLSNTEKFLQSRQVILTRKQIVELSMGIGGVAAYLAEVQAGQSPAQIINQFYFTPQGLLFSEFNRLFESLFDKADKHIKIVTELSKKRYGILQETLLSAAELPQSGTSSTVLRELEESGFIASTAAFGKIQRQRKYRLIDEFSCFYLKWVQPYHSEILRGSDRDLWHRLYQTQSWQSWAGYAFENICFKHIKAIKAALGIAGVHTTESHWLSKGEETQDGAEIDLIIDRSDGCINLCEIKFCQEEYVISKQYASQLIQKRERFRAMTNTRKSLFITLITPYGVKRNDYANELVQSEVILEQLF